MANDVNVRVLGAGPSSSAAAAACPTPCRSSPPTSRSPFNAAYAVVVLELTAIAYVRYRYRATPLAKTVVRVIVGGSVVLAPGRVGAGG